MKLAELLLQRAQLQSDLQDQALRIQENAQVLEGEEPNEKPDDILTGLIRLALIHCLCPCVVMVPVVADPQNVLSVRQPLAFASALQLLT